jgi:hypothetical protein
VDKVPDRDLVGLRIRNSENLQDKVVGIRLRRRDQLKPDMVWDVLGKVIVSNAKFAVCDRLEVHLDIFDCQIVTVRGLRRRKDGH